MCTSFRVKATDGSVVVGRTMEFPDALGTRLTVLPRGYHGVGTGEHGPGKSWTSTHGAVGMDAFGRPGSLTDGMNERGLYAALLYMPGFCDYTPTTGTVQADQLSIVDVVAHVLGVCGDVGEATTAMAAVTVWPYVFGPFGFPPPAHLVLHDASGASAVVEWRAGRMEVSDNPIGVACNSPHFDWHTTNLRNYVGLSDRNPSTVTVASVGLSAMGQGPGMFGLPGDSSSPSRFVRATAFTASLRPVASGAELEKTALHILNNFDIPFGLVREDDDAAHDDHTLWSSIANLSDRHYIVRTYDNPVPLIVDLDTVDFVTPGPREVALPDGGFLPLTV